MHTFLPPPLSLSVTAVFSIQVDIGVERRADVLTHTGHRVMDCLTFTTMENFYSWWRSDNIIHLPALQGPTKILPATNNNSNILQLYQ